MIDVTELVGTVFSGLSALVIEDVGDAGEVICVRARTRDGAVACPGCGIETARVHGYHERTVAGVPVGRRRVLARVRALPPSQMSSGLVRNGPMCAPSTAKNSPRTDTRSCVSSSLISRSDGNRAQ